MSNSTSFGVKRNKDETWREAVIRYAKKEQLEQECLAEFDHNVKQGYDEPEAAFHALYEWDCLEPE